MRYLTKTMSVQPRMSIFLHGGYLDRTRIPVGIDIGFGDVVYPDAVSIPQRISLKNKLYEQHITNRTSGDGQKHLPLPAMKHDHQGNRQQFRDAMAAGKDVYIFQTVNDQQAKHRGGQDISEILDIFRRRFSGGKQQKRQKAGQHGSGYDHQNRNNLLG